MLMSDVYGYIVKCYIGFMQTGILHTKLYIPIPFVEEYVCGKERMVQEIVTW